MASTYPKLQAGLRQKEWRSTRKVHFALYYQRLYHCRTYCLLEVHQLPRRRQHSNFSLHRMQFSIHFLQRLSTLASINK
ncbi:Uncharacterized protein HZ326_5799 [Fusarium oxysporum f. sp. albedinis]|nr:Uncharacterized protein HZ326_5799 [Fusarium oxysporum f. sp. albedinis]